MQHKSATQGKMFIEPTAWLPKNKPAIICTPKLFENKRFDWYIVGTLPSRLAMNTPRIFISYSSKEPDIAIARAFNEGLINAGFHTFFAEKSIGLGDEWAEIIEKEITSFDYFLVFLSKNSKTSDMVVEEIRRAKTYYDSKPKKNKPAILPIRINIPLEEGLNYDIDGYLKKFQQKIWENESHTKQYLESIINSINKRNEPIISREEQKTVPVREYDEDIPMPVAPLEIPGGRVSINSQYYIVREGEEKFVNTILSDFALLRIFAPRQYGKTLLLSRIIDCASKSGHYVIALNLQLMDADDLENLERLLKVICIEAAERMELSNDETDEIFKKTWEQPVIGEKRKCDKFFELLLKKSAKPVVLAFDEVDRLFPFEEVSKEFFGLLRSWNEKGKMTVDTPFDKLKMVVTYSSEAFLAIPDVNQSPFNVGLEKQLIEFSFEDFEKLIIKHGLKIETDKKKALYDMLGGHPFLTRKALYHLASDEYSIDDILTGACKDGGPFDDHLKRHFWNLSRKSRFLEVFKNIVIYGKDTINLDVCNLLKAAGLIKGNYPDVVVKNSLYKKYFKDKLQID